MLQTDTLESAIRQKLARVGTCTLKELNERLTTPSRSHRVDPPRHAT